jgi:hypothetical protein
MPTDKEKRFEDTGFQLGLAVRRYHEEATRERRASGEDEEGARIGAVGDTMYMALEGLMMLFLREVSSPAESDAMVVRVFGLKLAEGVVRLATSIPSIRGTVREVTRAAPASSTR